MVAAENASLVKKVLVIGASGFLGGHVAHELLAEGYEVRCLARNPAKLQGLAKAGCETVTGDISDLASMQRAMHGVQAAYISIHTLSPQPANTAGHDFMDVERRGLENIVEACRTQGVRRLIYVTFLGIAPENPSAWVRGRWQAEQFLLKSGLDVTCIRPAQIVGVGGQGFDMMVSNAKKPVALMIAPCRQRMRNIAVDDLVYYLIGVLQEPRAFGQCYDVGCDDILTNDQMLDITAEIVGRKHPIKIHLPPALLGALAPLIARLGKLPKGAMKGILDSLGSDAVGDPEPIRMILPRPTLPYRQAVELALKSNSANAGIVR